MKVLVVYCHPSKTSFTHKVKEEFVKGLQYANHEYDISDLYEMSFNEVLSEEEYLREAYYKSEIPVAEDVLIEQKKVQEADAIAFIYPVFWTEAPAKLVGWFDRVWTCGFAYNPEPQMKILKKAIFIAIAGKTLQTLEETGEKEAMETVMLGDRVRHRAKEKKMVILDEMTHWNEEAYRNSKINQHLQDVYELGRGF
ncbi:NAD(P)H-dependent oxidoreductase [Cellulosilyticum sp. ST5]|uniref:NAD(P)H-dependent oxidoreductase n=1 Tax=unclassified Cellulosilyticum TaxID=2643091 RepID=UPI000F8D4DF6|nr:NAD(P)H-dependent oxidoreductase [Cellulosilyticum sp. WCF-2]QEH68006.1 flavodoxin family protein [Cellulosilyticum sp. WCF-2]